ncbi:MAG: hypothetical protein II843_00165 [Alphaproteobacteria bacterium]|nr:hypothetical protein [Alphaproteobacteria bacterium]
MKIYFDMDGVLANFDFMTPDSAAFNHPSKTLSTNLRAQKKQFWLNIEKNKNFWRDIPAMSGTEHMLSIVQKYGELFVLSKTPGSDKFECGAKYVEFIADEKRKWISKHLGNFFNDEHVIICNSAKGALIKPKQSDVLVDDREENISEWVAHGGQGILFTKSLTLQQMVKQIILQR